MVLRDLPGLVLPIPLQLIGPSLMLVHQWHPETPVFNSIGYSGRLLNLYSAWESGLLLLLRGKSLQDSPSA